MKIITYQIELLESTLVTSLDGDPNSAVAFDYLPGPVLRGMVIAQYMRRHALKELDATKPDIQQLFFNGSVRYLNGYLLYQGEAESTRSLPTPLSWQQDKDALLAEEDKKQVKEDKKQPLVYDIVLGTPDDDEELDLQKAKKPFVAFVEGSMIKLLTPERQINIHTSRDRRKGRSTKKSGDIYQYEVLSPGQTFQAVILCDNDTDANIIENLLTNKNGTPKRTTLGGSRNAGYGRIDIINVQQSDEWLEGQKDWEPSDKLIVTLTSDLLLRNGQGQYTTDVETVEQLLKKQLGCTLSCEQAFVETKIVGGFNRKWGLPLPQTRAIKMGSTFVFEWPANDTELNNLLQKGIGERRAEGFGRFVINWNEYETLEVKGRDDKESRPVTITDTESIKLAQEMVIRLFRQQLENKLVGVVNQLVKKELPVKNSQLSRLRQIVQNALAMSPEEGKKRLLEYLANLDKRTITRNQFNKARMEGEPLLDWLENRMNDQSSIEQKLKLEKMPQLGGNVVAKWTPEIRYEFNLRLVDGVLAQALKEAAKRETGE